MLREAAAVEEVFYSANVKTALKLAHVRGVALVAVAESAVELAEYSPLKIKTSVVGYGRAEKAQVQTDGVRAASASKSRSNPKTPPTPWRWPSAMPPTLSPAGGWRGR